MTSEIVAKGVYDDVATDADHRAAERLLQLPMLPIIPGIRWVDPDEWEAGEPSTFCDLCGDPDDEADDWNAETGNHRLCEEMHAGRPVPTLSNEGVAYMKSKALLDEYRRIENGR